MLEIHPKNYPSMKQSALTKNARRIFVVMLTLFILVDSSERFLNINYDNWIYLVIFMLFVFSITLMGIAEIEGSIDDKIRN